MLSVKSCQGKRKYKDTDKSPTLGEMLFPNQCINTAGKCWLHNATHVYTHAHTCIAELRKQLFSPGLLSRPRSTNTLPLILCCCISLALRDGACLLPNGINDDILHSKEIAKITQYLYQH